MNALSVFLFTNIEERGRIQDGLGLNIDLEDIANNFLTPLRVLWHGRIVQIVRAPFSGDLESLHHVASFHRDGNAHSCRTSEDLHSSKSDWVLTILAIFCLIPGLLIGLPLKFISHAWNNTRINYKLVCEHFQTTRVEIGSQTEPASERTEDLCFETALQQLTPLNKKVNELIVHGNGQFILTARGDLIRRLNPGKIILAGTQLERGEAPSAFWHPMQAARDGVERIVDGIREIATGDFLPAVVASGKFEMEDDGPKIYNVNSIEEARAHTPPLRANGKPFHALYQIIAEKQ